MSSVLNTNGDTLSVPAITDIEGFKCAVITAKWNSDITFALRDGALDVLRSAGVDDNKILQLEIPGTVELVNAAAAVANRGLFSAIIVIGCVIRGDTPHFDYVCQIAAQGCAEINARGLAPLIFGVLTVENLEQAQERAGGKLGNKGAEAAVAAIEMHNLHKQLAMRNE